MKVFVGVLSRKWYTTDLNVSASRITEPIVTIWKLVSKNFAAITNHFHTISNQSWTLPTLMDQSNSAYTCTKWHHNPDQEEAQGKEYS